MDPSTWFLIMLLPCAFSRTLAQFNFEFQLGANSEYTTTSETILTTDVTTAPVPNFNPLSEQEKEEIVQRHNDGRRSVYPTSSNMQIVAWDEELDKAANASTESCSYSITTSTDFDPSSRQVVQFAGITQVESFRISTSISSWFNLGDYYRYTSNVCLPSAPSVDYCNIYKLLTWAEMTKIGCAQKFCKVLYDAKTKENRENIWYFKCNYEEVGRYHTNIHAYSDGEKCTECSSGSGWCNDKLCDESCPSSSASCSCAWDESTCNNHGSVDQTNCQCICSRGWSGDKCEIPTTPWPTTVLATTDLETTVLPTTELVTTAQETTFGSTTDLTTIYTTESAAFVATTNATHIDTRLLHSPCKVDNGGCSHICRVLGLSNRVICSCWRGYQLRDDGTSCASMDGFCSEGNDCEQTCTDLDQGHICSCNTSYILVYDKASCALDVCNLGTYCSMNGLLDEDTCTCHCFSGYKGELCNSTCNIYENSCWINYERPFVRYDREMCPIFNPNIVSPKLVQWIVDFVAKNQHRVNYNGVFSEWTFISGGGGVSQENGLSSFPHCPDDLHCDNEGYVEKQGGYEDEDGMCRCYCPFPWSGAICNDCNLQCIHGTLDSDNCTCVCDDGYYGNVCTKICTQTSLLCTRHTQERCNHRVIRKHCPVMCGDCTLHSYVY